MAVNTEEISALVARVLEESTPRTIELVTEKLQSGKIKVKKAISLPEAIDIALSKSKTKSQSFYCVSHGKHFGKILAYRGVAKTLYEFYDNIYMRDIALTLKDKMTILLYIQIWQKLLSVAKLKT